MKADDRRRRIRVPLSKTIRHSTYQVLGTPVFQESSAIDLSSGGISFETVRDYQNGNLVLLEFEINEERVKILVCVAWTKKIPDGRFQVGAELVAIDPEQQRKLQGHLGTMIKSLLPKKKAKKKIAKKKVAKKKTAKKVSKKTTQKKTNKRR